MIYYTWRHFTTFAHNHMNCAIFFIFFFGGGVIGSISVTVWKGQLDQNPMSRQSKLCCVYGLHGAMGETTVIGVCSIGAGGWYKVLQIIENLSSPTSRFICKIVGMRTVERSHPRPLAGVVSDLWAKPPNTKMQAAQVGTKEQSITRSRGRVRAWILLYNFHHPIRAIVQPGGNNFCCIVSLVTCPRINRFLISLFSYIFKQVRDMLLSAYPLHVFLITYNSKSAKYLL